MYSHPPSTNPRKRAAPGASSAVQTPQMQQTYNAGSQLPNAEFLRWSQNPETQNFADATSGYNMNIFGSNGLPQTTTAFDHPVTPQAHSTQLTRRPNINNNRQLVGPRTYDSTGDGWGSFGDDTMMDSQNGNGTSGENDDIEALEEKAAVAKRDAQSKRKQIPPFVQKLSSFLDESKNTELIRWSDRGDSFVVLDEDEFAKTLIPELFKHNNYASFVRQLNMYGFHKRVGLSDNSMKASERKNKSPSEYYNPYFKRGHPNLLWLINKPKGGANTKRKGGRVKAEDLGDGDSDDDGRDIEETFSGNYNNNATNNRAISVAPESGPLQRREMALVQSQLSDIQKQQSAISQAITRLRKDHNQLYQQAIAFQNLHERHESSINAILTFLATVYNRSLDGQGAENITRMFQTGLNQQGQHQHQGNVVDIGDLGTPQQQQPPGSVSPSLRKAQKLLTAGPTDRENSRVTEASPTATTPRNQYSTPRSGTVEELFESPSDSTTSKIEPQRDMLNLINNANAQTRPDNNAMEFPDMLTHYENANGNSPLTSEQRSNMLNIIASTSSAPGSNNALVSPAPQAPDLEQLAYTQAEIDDLMRSQHQQGDRIANLSAVLQPLSPSGSIPGVQGDSYFNNTDAIDPHNANLDLDQFLNSGAFYNASSPVNPNFSFDDFGNGVDGNGGYVGGESHFDVGMDGVNDGNDVVNGNGNSNSNSNGSGNGMGRIVETVASSEAASPEDDGSGLMDGDENNAGNKRRRKA
ncbi:Heat shock transcription factor [Ciborinia camelliae]|nr:Heat shock transcription factor [Ciborinia camelliae]